MVFISQWLVIFLLAAYTLYRDILIGSELTRQLTYINFLNCLFFTIYCYFVIYCATTLTSEVNYSCSFSFNIVLSQFKFNITQICHVFSSKCVINLRNLYWLHIVHRFVIVRQGKATSMLIHKAMNKNGNDDMNRRVRECLIETDLLQCLFNTV